MKIDLAVEDPPASPSYDVVVVGAGPAGITVAKELAGKGWSVCVLESGRARRTRHADGLKAVTSRGIHIKDYSRERVLGGASTTWAGLSSPFDPIDFEPRPFLAVPGWPIAREVLMPYYARASERYRFGALADFELAGFPKLAQRGDIRPHFQQLNEKVFLAAVPPQNFAREHFDVWEDGGAHLYLDATVTALASAIDRVGVHHIRAARVRTSRGRDIEIRGRFFVAAAGGIENARLLLASQGSDPAGLGNGCDQVGRYLMNHPKNYHGMLRLTRPVRELPYFFGCVYKGFAGYAGLRLSEPEQHRRRVLNSYVRFEPLFPWSDNAGVESLVLLAKRMTFLMRRFQRTKGEEVVTLRDYSETGDDSALQNARKAWFNWIAILWNIVRHAPSVLAYLFFRLSKRAPRVRWVRLRNFMEMEPHPDNRVRLGDALDPYGLRIPSVEHRCTDLDQRSLIELHAQLVVELRTAGVGELTTSLAGASVWPIDQDASHHMGTTRMGADPASSVVDRDCRVWSTSNLWVAGASVLPTSGCANPTYTLVALAIRLADHLDTQLKAPSPANP